MPTWPADHPAARRRTSGPPPGCPLPRSTDLLGIEFTGRYATYEAADTWYPTWAADGHLYTPWTDGSVGGFACGSKGFLAATGHARIEGEDPLDLEVVALGSSFGNPEPYEGRYPAGSLVVDGVWYYGTYCLDTRPGSLAFWDVMGPFVGFRTSTDGGRSWTDPPHTPAAPLFGESSRDGTPIRFGAPHVVDLGCELEHSPDGAAYLVAHGATDPDAICGWVGGDHVYLARVVPSPATMNDPAAYTFHAGHDADGTPRWTDQLADAVPLIDWPGHTGTVTITSWAARERYLMWVTAGGRGIDAMDSYLCEAEALTGPWRLVTYLPRFGPQAYFLNSPSRFLSDDGRTGWLLYSGNYTDHWGHPEDPDQVVIADPPGTSYAMVLQEFVLLEG